MRSPKRPNVSEVGHQPDDQVGCDQDCIVLCGTRRKGVGAERMDPTCLQPKAKRVAVAPKQRNFHAPAQPKPDARALTPRSAGAHPRRAELEPDRIEPQIQGSRAALAVGEDSPQRQNSQVEPEPEGVLTRPSRGEGWGVLIGDHRADRVQRPYPKRPAERRTNLASRKPDAPSSLEREDRVPPEPAVNTISLRRLRRADRWRQRHRGAPRCATAERHGPPRGAALVSLAMSAR